MSATDASLWRQRLARPRSVSQHNPESSDSPPAALALLVQLRTLERPGSQWTAPKAATATRITAPGTQRLAVRPATRSSSGKWVTSAVTWSTLAHRVERLHLSPAHVAWFTQFATLHRAGGEFKATETDWLYLDDFLSPLLWPLLDQAETLHLPLVATQQGGSVHRADVRAEVEIRKDGAGLLLQPIVTFDQDELIPTGAIGTHGLYAARFTGSALHVALGATSADGAELAQWREPVRVPVQDVTEFWRDHYPALAHRSPVRSHGVTLPKVKEETWLILKHHDNADVSTHWETRRGTHSEPLTTPPAAVLSFIPGAEALEFFADVLPKIEADGVRVEDVGNRPQYRELPDIPTLRLVAVPVEGKNDWFDLGFVIIAGPYTIPLARVVKALSKGQRRLMMVDKSWFRLTHPAFDVLQQLLREGAELHEWETGAIVSRYHANLFEPFEDTSASTPEAVAWRTAASALQSTPASVPPPPELQAVMRGYQHEGFSWLVHLWRHRLGGILADDMGLGKTLQSIALILHVRAQSDRPTPFLVVAPTSVIGAWKEELAKFAPTLRVGVVSSTQDAVPDEADVVLTSYTLFRLEFERFQARHWEGLILDEAQYLKNPASQAHECAYNLRAEWKIGLSGTPLENNLLDIWALFRIVAPGLFPSRLAFTNRYIKARSSKRIRELRARIRPLMLRRTKQHVATELPPKQEHVLTVELDPSHRALYDRFLQRERQKVLGLMQDLDRNRFIVFRSLTLLRRLALDPALIDTGDTTSLQPPVSRAKLDALVERLSALAEEGHRALVFSQFTSYLALVRARLEREGIAYAYLDGTTTKRAEAIDAFRAGSEPVFLISLRAGGVGLTLTEAEYVFLLDPWWNPAVEAQAIDRTHRIGQDGTVMVYRLVAKDTIEEKVLQLSERKRELFQDVIDGGDLFAKALTEDDVRGLLA